MRAPRRACGRSSPVRAGSACAPAAPHRAARRIRRGRGRRRRRGSTPRESSQRQNSSTSTRYARRVPSERAGEARKRSAAESASRRSWIRRSRPAASVGPRPRLDLIRHFTDLTFGAQLRGEENRVGSKRWGVAPRVRTQASLSCQQSLLTFL